tara:strand:- start:1326 stop:1592 length:267 start_codon:yes stop_codon:yes gene_type:complete
MTQSKPKQVPTKPKRIPASKVKKVPTKVDKKFEENEVAKPTSFDTNKFKYAQETLVGEPTIHPPGGIVTSVGLGGLKTETNYGSKPNV